MNQTTYKGPDHPHFSSRNAKENNSRGIILTKVYANMLYQGKKQTGANSIPNKSRATKTTATRDRDRETERFSKTETKLRKSGKSLPEEGKYLNDDLSRNFCSRKQKKCFTRTNNNNNSSNADGST
jgi:hypothetical protein